MVMGRTDWQGNLVEDNKLTYTPRGTAVRLTVREASSAGFLKTNFSDAGTSASFEQVPNERPINSAISQKMDWTVVDSKNFGMTVFGYQNQVGSGFKPFGETKTEFSTAGTRNMKFGGQVRVGTRFRLCTIRRKRRGPQSKLVRENERGVHHPCAIAADARHGAIGFEAASDFFMGIV